mgnify:CR=1 FL=1
MLPPPKCPLFIVFEGIDGAGKTSIAKELAKSIHGLYIQSPPKPFDQIKQRVLENAVPIARFLYFLSSNIQLSELAKSALRKNHVVSDRYIWSTIAYHSALENISPNELKAIVMPFMKFLIMPDYVVFLTVKRKIQLQRLRNRVENGLQKRLLVSNDFQTRLKEAYRYSKELFDVNWIEIDTSYKSIHELVSIIRHTIKV